MTSTGPEQKVPTDKAQETGAAAPSAASTEDLPAAPGTTPEPVVIGTRQGMFGVHDDGDTSGYAGLVTPVLFPAASVRPYGRYFDEVAEALQRVLGPLVVDQGSGGERGADGESGADGEGGPTAYGVAVERVVVDRGEMTLFVARAHLLEVMTALRNDPALRFDLCLGVSGVHYPHESGRELHAVYNLLSITNGGRRLRVEVTCPDDDRHIPSVVSVYPGNDWHERETWDMFGIEFDGHPALTRILMPDDWPGHPQRKDYPLGGIPVEYKGATIAPPDERRSYS